MAVRDTDLPAVDAGLLLLKNRLWLHEQSAVAVGCLWHEWVVTPVENWNKENKTWPVVTQMRLCKWHQWATKHFANW